ncbi:MAG: SprB repeat-containing protein, partial [Bacteroidia bacterium]|nr:SprB repeat-containing protein [Bacteroidia bacterium]
MIRGKHILFFLFAISSVLLFAQQGKDGTPTISASTIVNEYETLTADINPGDISIQVSSSTLNANSRFASSLAAGDLIFIYQTRGATIRGENVVSWGGNGQPRDRTMGELLNYNNTGHYEFAEVKAVPNGTTIEVSCPLTKAFTSGLGRTQVIRVPRYASLTISGTGILTAQTWNGTTGGVQVTEVKGNTVINAGGKIDVTGLGFRGGLTVKVSENPSNNEGTNNNTLGADKGEGVSGYMAEYNTVAWNNGGGEGGGRYGKNPMANGGGGGCSVDGGGGGGANGGVVANWYGRGVPDLTGNYGTAWALEDAAIPTLNAGNSSGGGKGGYAFSAKSGAPYPNPMLVGPHQVAWGGDQRDTAGGLGGRPLDYSTGALFLGGGGGAGQGDNGYAGSGGNGGGLIYLLCFGNVSGAGQIVANGANGGAAQGTPSVSVLTGKDGAGGGGGGGAIIINSSVSGISAIANGGKGGDQIMVHGAFSGQYEAQGPGGGGGGGYIAVQSGAITQQVNGGANGTTNSPMVNSIAGSVFPPNGATAGGTGTMNQIITNYYISVRDTTLCGNASVKLTAALTGTSPGGSVLTWYDASTGGNTLTTGTSYTTPVLSATTTYYVGVCPGFYRVPVKVTIGAGITAILTPTNATCSTGGSVSVSVSGGSPVFTYLWSNGSSAQTISNVVAANYTVTVTDAGGCTTTNTATVGTTSGVTINSITPVNNTCSGKSAGSATVNPTGGTNPYTYTWSNGLTGTSSITGLAANIYTVTVTDGSGCTSVSTVTITEPPALATPTITPTNAACGSSNGSAVATASG